MKLRSANRVNYSTSFVGSNFLPLRTLLIFTLMGLSLMNTGCKSVQPVSSTETKTQIKKDSTVTRREKKDSLIDRETVQEVKIPQSVIDFYIGNAKKLDSVITALKSLPKGVPQIITIPDKSGRAMFQLLLDSIGGLHARCTAKDEIYYNKLRQIEHYNESLIKELTSKNIENSDLKTQVVRAQKPFWQRFWDSIDSWISKIVILFVLVGLLIIIFRTAIKRLSGFTWTGRFINFFNRGKS